MSVAERREREKQHRIQEIIQAAEKVFFSKGYMSATMDEIAREAQLGKGTLYLYFKGKDEVHKAIVARGMDILFGIIKSAAGSGASGMDKIMTVWDSFMRFRSDYPNYCDAFIHYETKDIDGNNPEDVDQWVNKYKVINFMISALREGMADGSIRPDIDPVEMTLVLWAQITGAILMIRFKRALVSNLLQVAPDAFLASFQRLVNENLVPRRVAPS